MSVEFVLDTVTDGYSVIDSPIERICMIDGISHSITNKSWTVDIAFSNADSRAFLALDDPVFGALNANRLAF